MPDERIFIAKKVAHQLFAVENAIDQALADAAGFAASLPEARMQAKLPAVMGQEALDSAFAMVAALNEARRHMVEMHNRLDETKKQMGFREVQLGSLMPKPGMAYARPAAAATKAA